MRTWQSLLGGTYTETTTGRTYQMLDGSVVTITAPAAVPTSLPLRRRLFRFLHLLMR